MRIKRGTTKHQRHHSIKLATKGMQKGRRRSYRLGKQAVTRALQYAYRDRNNKKRDFRRLWIQRINAAARENGISYSVLIKQLAGSEVSLNRKVLSQLAFSHPEVFKNLIDQTKSKS